MIRWTILAWAAALSGVSLAVFDQLMPPVPSTLAAMATTGVCVAIMGGIIQRGRR